MKTKKSLWAILLFLGFTSCIYAPYEMYLNNADDFWFSLVHFWWIPLVCGGFAILVGAGVGCILKKRLFYLYEGLLFGFGIAVYIQSNFLNLDVGLMDGTAIAWENYYSRFFINAVVWALCILGAAVILFLQQKAEKVFGYASLLLTAMQMVALIVLLVPALFNMREQKDIGYLSDKDLYEVGDQENVLVFILDMFDDNYLDEILTNEPELTEELDGFTQYTNITGSYSTTQYSILTLAAGVPFYNEMSWYSWKKEIGNQRLYMDELRDAGYEIDLYLQDEFVPDRLKREADNYIEAPLRINHYKDFTIDLYRFVLCKYFPDFLKQYVWMDGTELDRWKEPASEYGVWEPDNFALLEGLEENSVSADKETKQVKFIHINGSHPPYNMDEYCNRTWAGEVTPVQCGRGALRIVQQYLDILKEKGIYDRTSVIITADHGYYWAGVLTNPALMVKPEGAAGSLQYSDAPVSLFDIPATILDLAGVETSDYGQSVLDAVSGRERHRNFYQYFLKKNGPDGNCRLVEYEISDASNDYENFRLTDVEYTWDGVKRQHTPYCKVCRAGGPTQEELDEYDPPRVVHELIDSDY